MASNEFTVLCAVASFLWLSSNIQQHQLIEQPRISYILLFLAASLASFAASFILQWLRSRNGRLGGDDGFRGGALEDSPSEKPRRRFLTLLVTCTISRLEVFHQVSANLQCSKPGIESLLPLLVLFFELGRSQVRKEDYDDMGETIYEAIGKWVNDFVNDSHLIYILSIFLLSGGGYLVTTQHTASTYFCSSLDPGSLVVWMQWAGLLLDCSIVILSWRVFTWTLSTRARLRTLGNILLASAIGTAVLSCMSRFLQVSPPMSDLFRDLHSLFTLGLFFDGLVFAVFLGSSSLLIADGKPLPLVGILTFLSAIFPATQKIKAIGSWENLSPATTAFGFGLLCLGFSFFIFAGNIRSVLLIRRTILVLILAVLVIATTIYSIVKGSHTVNDHPLQRLIYDSRVGANRWLVQAATSNSLPVAVREYEARHHGRKPPAKFDVWYDFASLRYSPIVDHFAQIDSDLLPFWGLSPQKIREDISRLSSEPGIAIVKIKSGRASHNLGANSAERASLEDLVEMINTFAEHLPDMELAINTNETPRVLAPWDDVQNSISAGAGESKYYKRDTVPPEEKDKPEKDKPEKEKPSAQLFQESEATRNPLQSTITPVRTLREMTGLTCPSGTGMRSGVRWNTRDFCSSCAKPQSQGQYPTNWALYQELCHQPDLLRLHSFYMTSPKLRPLQELVPVFSKSKTDNYRDILIPLQPSGQPPNPSEDKDFITKRKALFWRGIVDRRSKRTTTTNQQQHDLIHGGHQERLVHLVNNNINHTIRSDTTLILPASKSKDRNNVDKFTYNYQHLSTESLNNMLPFDIKFTTYNGPNKAEMTIKPDSDSGDNPLKNQYILTIDSDSGPPPAQNFLSVLHSNSVPFYGSIFKEWYTERLLPWVHYVPVDLRWHALHGTLAYFTGLEPPEEKVKKPVDGNKKKVEKSRGRTDNFLGMHGNVLDGKWIAEEGRKWAGKALRREDMEVYLFRLLLEWARIVSDDREGMGFVF
ncbi:glycosyltransferase [Rhypophila sp. PSN 637]